jgi:uncharacterized membrane protein YoaK (UPF0700 family)
MIKALEILIKVLIVYGAAVVFATTYIKESDNSYALLKALLAATILLLFLFWNRKFYDKEKQRIPYPIFLLFAIAILMIFVILGTYRLLYFAKTGILEW